MLSMKDYSNPERSDSNRIEACNTSKLRRTPRSLKRTSDGVGISGGMSWFVRIFMLPHTLIGIALLVFPFLYIGNIVIGTDVPASVIDKYTHVDDEDGRKFDVEVAYDWDGKKNYKKFSATRSEYESYKVGDPVAVRFLPAFRDWTINFRAKGESVKLPDLGAILFYGFFAGFWNFVVGIFAFVFYVLPVINSRLLKTGCVSQGVVRSKEEIPGSESTTYKITCEFTPDKTKTRKSSKVLDLKDFNQKLTSEASVPKTLFDRVNQGDLVNVIYFPNKPSINTVFEYSGYEMV